MFDDDVLTLVTEKEACFIPILSYYWGRDILPIIQHHMRCDEELIDSLFACTPCWTIYDVMWLYRLFDIDPFQYPHICTSIELCVNYYTNLSYTIRMQNEKLALALRMEKCQDDTTNYNMVVPSLNVATLTSKLQNYIKESEGIDLRPSQICIFNRFFKAGLANYRSEENLHHFAKVIFFGSQKQPGLMCLYKPHMKCVNPFYHSVSSNGSISSDEEDNSNDMPDEDAQEDDEGYDSQDDSGSWDSQLSSKSDSDDEDFVIGKKIDDDVIFVVDSSDDSIVD
jgi:hypothetical protein